MDSTSKYISERLSLRKPQKRALEALTKISKVIELPKPKSEANMNDAVKAIEGFDKFIEFERTFPSTTFALATGVGKTRLMGAFVAYLNLQYGIKNFLVVAPNLTIYNKLIEDFETPTSSKFVFQGIAEFVHNRPRIITGDNYSKVSTQRYTYGTSADQGLLFKEEITINIFNISKINKEEQKIKKINEYLGEPYFEYLKNLEDLVILMDESHHYRAKRGMDVINELSPILGLEVTATPMITRGARTIPFKNVVYEYPLSKAIRDGYVKDPAAATRKGLTKDQLQGMTNEEKDLMKLEDAIQVHEQTKLSLEMYARNNNKPLVKPFILVVAQDTSHANEILATIQADSFYEGRYRDKVITVHSAQRGEEKEENVQQLLTLEDPKNETEIVIHVNMLKEGWDVTNLYTIVPLRAFAAEILTEQTLGRGLRLPYGERTGDPEVDKLTVIAHDRFEDLIKRAQEESSIILKEYFIEPNPDVGKQEVQSVKDVVSTQLDEEAQKAFEIEDEEARKVALARVKVKKNLNKNIQNVFYQVDAPKDIEETQRKEEFIQKTKEELKGEAKELGLDEESIEKIAREEVEKLIEQNLNIIIEIPRIVIQPAGDPECGYNDFELDTSDWTELPPVEDEIIIKALQSQRMTTINVRTSGESSEDVLENYLVAELIDKDDIDYDENVDLLYKLAKQAISFVKGYADEDKVENIVQGHKTFIADRIYSQMEKQFYFKQTDFERPIVKPHSKIEKHNYSRLKGQEIKDYRVTASSRAELRKNWYGGFHKASHPYYKFDVIAEHDLAKVLESDSKVLKWMRPAQKQFHIYWNHQTSLYEPDFVVEAEGEIALVEVKNPNDIDSQDVQDKKRAAVEYCNHATTHNQQNGKKPWNYYLIPSDKISQNMDWSSFVAHKQS
jgi:type III restriction enzyme